MKNLPFYFILFQEVNEAEEALAEIRECYLQDEDQHTILNEQLFYAKGDDEPIAAGIISLCQTPPFTGKRHFVLIRRAEKLGKEEKKALFDYLKTPPPYALLVFMFQGDGKAKLPFTGHQLKFLYTGREQLLADNFGITNALNRGDTQKALEILGHQFRAPERDFPRLFGILTWHLRTRVAMKSRTLTERHAGLFAYCYALEKDVRQGRLDRRTALEMAVVKLSAELR